MYSAKDIEKIIYAYLPEETGHQKTVLSAMNYAMRAGGKRLRPMMLRICYDMFARDNREEVVAPFMAAMEMIHTYSLIHDDLPAMDNDELRRGLPTVHVKFGEDMAILAGDGLLNYAYEVAVKSMLASPGNLSVEKAFAVLTRKPGIYGMVGGQVLDVERAGRPMDEEQLAFVYENKTSALIECSMMCGALLAGADDSVVQKLEEIASAVGLAFQVQDDILDLVGDEQTLGKPVLSDEKNQKVTYVTVHGMENARAYVRSMSEKAMSMLSSLQVENEAAKSDMIELVKALIDRDH